MNRKKRGPEAVGIEVSIWDELGEEWGEVKRTSQGLLRRLHQSSGQGSGQSWVDRVLAGEGEWLESRVDGVLRRWRAVKGSELPANDGQWRGTGYSGER